VEFTLFFNHIDCNWEDDPLAFFFPETCKQRNFVWKSIKLAKWLSLKKIFFFSTCYTINQMISGRTFWGTRSGAG
jgi:hypothetical protein